MENKKSVSEINNRLKEIDLKLVNLHLLTGSQIMSLNSERKELIKIGFSK